MTASRASTIVRTASVSFSQPSVTFSMLLAVETVEARPSGEMPSAEARSATVSE